MNSVKRRKWWIAALSLLAAFVVAYPLLTTHAGKSLEIPTLTKKLGRLVHDYKAKTGQWPENFEQINNALRPELEYTYPMLCEYHPWRETGSGTLVGARLIRDRSEPWDGILLYRLRLARSTAPPDYAARIWVDSRHRP